MSLFTSQNVVSAKRDVQKTAEGPSDVSHVEVPDCHSDSRSSDSGEVTLGDLSFSLNSSSVLTTTTASSYYVEEPAKRYRTKSSDSNEDDQWSLNGSQNICGLLGGNCAIHKSSFDTISLNQVPMFFNNPEYMNLDSAYAIPPVPPDFSNLLLYSSIKAWTDDLRQFPEGESQNILHSKAIQNTPGS